MDATKRPRGDQRHASRERTTAHVCAALALFLLITATTAEAQLSSLEAEGVRFVYSEGAESHLLPHVARTLLNSLAFQKKLFGFEPSDEISLLLTDLSDAGNATASSVPRNGVIVDVAPLNFAFETIAANDRMNVIMNHELVHIAAMDQATRRDRMFRRVFGGKVLPVAEQPESILYFFLTSPRVAAPRWYHEGIAVFLDTWMAGGLGRAQSGYDEMVFRAMVKDGTPFYDPLGLVSEGTKIDFQLQMNSYLYGTRFMTWLARRYGPERLVAWVARHEGSRGYYAAQFRQVFGTSLERAWAAWMADEHTFQSANLAAIRRHPLTTAADITSRALGSISRAYLDASGRTMYAAFNYPGVVAHIGAISLESGSIERLIDIKGPVPFTVTSLAFDPAGTLFYTTDNGGHRDLLSLDVATGRAVVLQKDLRIGDLAFNHADGSLWGIRHLGGICTLARIAPPYRDWKQIVTFPYGTVVYDLDISPDGTQVVASFGEISGRQEVRVLSVAALLKGDETPVARFDFGTAVPNNFVFSSDGRFLYGSSYYTGVSNIFRYEIATGQLDAMSNSETGFFRPVPIGGDELIVFRYTGQGFVPARIAAKPVNDLSNITFLGERLAEEHPIVKDWMLGSPAAIPYETIPKRAGTYRIAGSLRPESFYPILQGYKDAVAIGLRATFSDPLQLNRLSVATAYSPDGGLPTEERIHVRADYTRHDWRGRFEWNGADFYDLFGPTKTSRKGYAVHAGHRTTLIFDEPRRMHLDVDGFMAGNLDRLPEYQNVPASVSSVVGLAATLSSTNVRTSLGGVDEEKGTRWTARISSAYVQNDVVPKLMGTFDHGIALPVRHSSVWLRHAAGFSPTHDDNPFASFYFGGFGNNYVDRLDEKRYRAAASFPGVGINEIGGPNFIKSMIEWNLPPWRFRRMGTPGLHVTWARPAVFATALASSSVRLAEEPVSRGRRTLANIGAQVDLRISALSTLDLTLSIGGAVAIEQGSHPRREAMVSLKVLRQ
jgi:hypothetical protein